MNYRTKPLISIGMPVYNGERHLNKALESLTNQDYENFEIIISDDASTDSTAEICREYQSRDRRIALYTSTLNRGMMWNFNRVLELARGSIFMWAAYDDYRDSNFLSTLLEPLGEDNSVQLSSPRVVKVWLGTNHTVEHRFPEDLVPNDLHSFRILLDAAEAGWAYGLFRTAELRKIFAQVYRHELIWGWDFILLLPYILNRTIVGTNCTTFYQLKTGLSAQRYAPQSVRQYFWLARRMMPLAYKMLWKSNVKPLAKTQLALYLPIYLEKKVFHLRRTTLARRLRSLGSPVSRVNPG